MEYYVGDLCYVFNDTWDEVCEHICGEERKEGWITLRDGRTFWIHSTMWGDGGYYDQHDNEYGVDSGTLGLVKVCDMDDDARPELGHIHTMHSPVCHADMGILHFGSITIDTE